MKGDIAPSQKYWSHPPPAFSYSIPSCQRAIFFFFSPITMDHMPPVNSSHVDLLTEQRRMTGLRGRDTTLKATKRKRLLHRFALDTAESPGTQREPWTGRMRAVPGYRQLCTPSAFCPSTCTCSPRPRMSQHLHIVRLHVGLVRVWRRRRTCTGPIKVVGAQMTAFNQ